MADYPSDAQVVGSRIVPKDGTELRRSVSGKPRLRTFYSGVEKEIVLVHDVYEAERDVISAFYLANRTGTFTVDWQGDTPVTEYTVKFSKNGYSDVPLQGDGYYRVTVNLVVV